MLKKSSKGVSLLEAFLSAIIFIISVSAIFVSFNFLRKPAVNNEQALGAALALRNVLEDLRSQVDVNIDSSNLSVTPPAHGPIQTGPGNIYTIYYNVTKDPATYARRVDANVSWADPM